MALHELHSAAQLADCRRVLGPADVLVLVEAATGLSGAELADLPCPVVALDVRDPGRQSAGVGVLPRIDADAWVALSEAHPHQLVWR